MFPTQSTSQQLNRMASALCSWLVVSVVPVAVRINAAMPEHHTQQVAVCSRISIKLSAIKRLREGRLKLS